MLTLSEKEGILKEVRSLKDKIKATKREVGEATDKYRGTELEKLKRQEELAGIRQKMKVELPVDDINDLIKKL